MKINPEILTLEIVTFHKMVQDTLDRDAICFHYSELGTYRGCQQTVNAARIIEAELLFENRGLINGGNEVGLIEYRGFILKGRSLNGRAFEAYGQVGRKRGQKVWCTIGLSMKCIESNTVNTYLGGINYHENPPSVMNLMEENRTDFVQWLVKG